jgi:hypothetical protein
MGSCRMLDFPSLDMPNCCDTALVSSAVLLGQLGYIAANETHLFEHHCTPGYPSWAAHAMHVPDALLWAALECWTFPFWTCQTLKKSLVIQH